MLAKKLHFSRAKTLNRSPRASKNFVFAVQTAPNLAPGHIGPVRNACKHEVLGLLRVTKGSPEALGPHWLGQKCVKTRGFGGPQGGQELP